MTQPDLMSAAWACAQLFPSNSEKAMFLIDWIGRLKT
jgi:hypothetical protein